MIAIVYVSKNYLIAPEGKDQCCWYEHCIDKEIVLRSSSKNSLMLTQV